MIKQAQEQAEQFFIKEGMDKTSSLMKYLPWGAGAAALGLGGYGLYKYLHPSSPFSELGNLSAQMGMDFQQLAQEHPQLISSMLHPASAPDAPKEPETTSMGDTMGDNMWNDPYLQNFM